MERIRGPDGGMVSFSNAALQDHCQTWIGLGVLEPLFDHEFAVLARLQESLAASRPGRSAFDLEPLDPVLASPEWLDFLSRLVFATLCDLLGPVPDEAVWEGRVAWTPARQQDWSARLACLFGMIRTVRCRRWPGTPMWRAPDRRWVLPPSAPVPGDLLALLLSLERRGALLFLNAASGEYWPVGAKAATQRLLDGDTLIYAKRPGLADKILVTRFGQWAELRDGADNTARNARTV